MDNEKIEMESKPTTPELSEAVRKRIVETEYGKEAGWIMEYQNQPVAILTNPRYEDMFWDRYDVTYLIQDLAVLSKLSNQEFWNEHSDQVVFRNREFTDLFAAYPIVSVYKYEPNIIVVRGLYLWFDHEPHKSQPTETPSPSQRFLSWFWRKMTEY